MSERENFSPYYGLSKDTIALFGEIDDDMANAIVQQLLYLDSLGVEKIKINIKSPGGAVSAGLAIYDTMNSVHAIIETVGFGEVSSMGAFLFSSGSKGHRYLMKNCRVMIHQPLGGVSGQASDIKLAAENIIKVKDKLNQILSENTGKSIEQIEKDTDRDYTMSADEAVSYGIADGIVPSINKAKGEVW